MPGLCHDCAVDGRFLPLLCGGCLAAGGVEPCQLLESFFERDHIGNRVSLVNAFLSGRTRSSRRSSPGSRGHPERKDMPFSSPLAHAPHRTLTCRPAPECLWLGGTTTMRTRARSLLSTLVSMAVAGLPAFPLRPNRGPAGRCRCVAGHPDAGPGSRTCPHRLSG